MPALQLLLRLQNGLAALQLVLAPVLVSALQPVLALVLGLLRIPQVRPQQHLPSCGCALYHPGASQHPERVAAVLRLLHESAELAWEEEIVTLSRSSDAYSSKPNGGVWA